MPNTITPKMWANGLFSVATQVPADQVDWDGSGWKLYSACPEGAVWCCNDSTADPVVPKKEPASGQVLAFKPFNVYQITGCDEGTSRLPENQAMNDTLALEWLNVNIEGWLSAGLELGACDSPGLIDLPDLTPTGDESLPGAVVRLIQNRQRDGLFDRPTIHVPSAAAASCCDFFQSIDLIADVALGPGYGIAAPTNAVVNGGWAYITGPVEYALGKKASDIAGLMDDDLQVRRRNYDDSLEEQLAAYRFDPCGGYRTQFKYC